MNRRCLQSGIAMHADADDELARLPIACRLRIKGRKRGRPSGIGIGIAFLLRDCRHIPDGRVIRTAGIVTLRQQPSTANGTIFVSLEDEFGAVQVIVWSAIRDEQRQVLLEFRLLAVKGGVAAAGAVANLIAHRLVDLTPWLERLGRLESQDFR